MYSLRKTVFRNFGRSLWKCSVKEERQGYERSGFDPGLRFSFFLIKTLSIKAQKFSKCLKNASDPLRKGTTAVASFSFAYFLG